MGSLVLDPIVYAPWSVLFGKRTRCDLCSQETLAGDPSRLAVAAFLRGGANTSNLAPVPGVFFFFFLCDVQHVVRRGSPQPSSLKEHSKLNSISIFAV